MSPLAGAFVCLGAGCLFGLLLGYGLRRRDDREAIDRVKGATVERDRLALVVRGFDKCGCGWYRRFHTEGMVGCRSFHLAEPADPLETIVTADITSEDGSETVTVVLDTAGAIAEAEARAREDVQAGRSRTTGEILAELAGVPR